jgi:hypothetical protein
MGILCRARQQPPGESEDNRAFKDQNGRETVKLNELNSAIEMVCAPNFEILRANAERGTRVD